MSDPAVTIFVCTTCRVGDEAGERPGKRLFDALQARLLSKRDAEKCVRFSAKIPRKNKSLEHDDDSKKSHHALGAIALQPVECLSVCKRPCTLALAAPGKWTYVVGDLSPETSLDDILLAATRYGATSDGIVPWRERPLPFRRGVISRTPPLAFAAPLGEERFGAPP